MAPRRWLSNRRLFQLHGWIGLNLGLLLFVVCFSGAIATVSHEIEWLFNPALRVLPSPGTPVARWTDWYNAVQSAHPGGRVLSIDLPQGPHSPVRATVAYASDDWRSVLVDPHTARVIGTLGEFGVARFFRSFHKQLYIYPGSLPHGVYAVGPLGVVLLLSLGTGLLFYRFRWRDLLMRGPWVNRRAFWSALHRATGMWVIPVAIVITATGVWYLVERVLQDASIRIPVGQVLRSTPTAPADAGGAWPIAIDDAVARAEQAVPNLRVQSVSFSNDARRWLTLTGQTDAWLVRDEANSVRLDPYSGQIQEVMVAAGLHPITRLAHTADILHFGTFGGLATKILWLIIGLFMSTAILLGVRVWYLRVVASSLPDPARASSAPAALAVTVIVLGVSVYGSVVNIGESLDIRRTVSFASLGGVSLGSSIVRVKAAVVDDKLQVVGAVPEGTARSTFRRGWTWVGAEDPADRVPDNAEPLVTGWHGVAATLASPGPEAGSRLWLAIEDTTGHAAMASLPITSDVSSPGILRPEGLVPGYVWVVVLLFVAITLAVCIGWYWWIQRSPQVTGRARESLRVAKPDLRSSPSSIRSLGSH